ncbi:MAG: ATP-binding cassette domain-containing protein, partial [Gemmatimonadota bacterium]
REIAYEDVSFAYRDGEPALRDVSLSVPKGGMLALVGASGSGKSTLVDLLGRFFDVTRGRITIDGTDIREVALADLRGLMGIVSQETVLFHDSVRANIAYGVAEATDDQVQAVARAAHAHEFIRRLPEGYDTVVGERGVELSGGQRQRIAIARALLRDPPILVLDEATSSLDTESERVIQDAIEKLLEGRTVFVIAHRLSTVQRADQILVMENGRIAERGTHASLLAESGRYRHLYELQFEERPVSRGT